MNMYLYHLYNVLSSNTLLRNIFVYSKAIKIFIGRVNSKFSVVLLVNKGKKIKERYMQIYGELQPYLISYFFSEVNLNDLWHSVKM